MSVKSEYNKLRIEFIDGVMSVIQNVALSHKEPSMARELMRESGFSEKDFLASQKRCGYRNREMNKIIRQAFKR